MRKLVKTLLSLSLMVPAAALALGLGDVQLHSDLNQRLDAEIKLLSVNPAEADSIQVSLASYEDFAKVGLERPGSLMFLRFALEQRKGGDYYIKISSMEPIRDPFLDFLLEVKWRSGRVLREYTLLLDPPVSHREAAPVITAPAPVAAPTSAPAPVQAEAADEFVPPPSSIPVAPGVKPYQPEPMAEAEATAEEEPSESAMTEALTAPAPKAVPEPKMPSGSIVYGPIKANETLWRIARKLRPSNDISDQQMMMALLKANPYAFFGNNINRLKKGYVLRIDDPSMISAMSKAEAAREVSRQTRAWQDARAARAGKAAKRQQAAAAESQAPSGAVAAAKKEPKLELVAPNGKSEQPAQGSEDTESLKNEMMLALESSAAQRKENEALQKRIQGLEEQLDDMQRLLSLKDADLAALQKQLREQGQALTLPSEKAVPPAEEETETPVTEPSIPEEGSVTEMAAEEKVQPEEGTEPYTGVTGTDSGEEAVEQPAAEGMEESPAEEQPEAQPQVAPVEKPPVAEKAAQKKPFIPQPVVKEPSIVDFIMENLNFALMGLGGLFVLILLMILVRRRRSGGFQESILSGGTSSMLNASEDDLGSETSFLSDLAISGMGGGSIQSDEGEVDPLTEADVFMAYGRNQQAEEVLTKALEKHPGRPDLTAKLLEVYYNLKDTDQFVGLAQASAVSLGENDELWTKVAAMGYELAPENSLFEGAKSMGQGGASPTESTETTTEDVLDIGLDIDELSSEMESEATSGEMDVDLGLDFGDLDEEENEIPALAAETAGDLDFDTVLGGTDEIAAEETTAEDTGMDFDFDLGVSEPEPSSEESTELDFDLGALGEEEPSDEFALDLGIEKESEEQSEDDSGLGDLSMDFDLGVAEEEVSETTESEMDLGDLGDIDFGDLGLGATEEETATETEDSLDLSELESTAGDLGDFGAYDDLGELDDEGLLSDSDEIATKLDLAQAYIEMGDSDGARSMLEEVAVGGTDDQKQQAQELLSKI